MITCQDILELQLDGVELIAGEEGLDHPVTWTYMVQTRPFAEHMNQGNFALCVIDYVRYDFEEAQRAMEELYELGISGFAVSVMEDREWIPQKMIDRANELALPLFYIRWEGASFVDIAQSVGKIILEHEIQNKRTGDYLYNLLFGYDINDRYIEKISSQFGINFTNPCRVGIIVADRRYGINLEQDEHIYEYYANYLNQEVMAMEGKPMFLRFLNKFVLLFEARKDKSIEHALEQLLQKIDASPQFYGSIKSTCILGGVYTNPADFGRSYQEAKRLISKKDMLPNPKHKKVLSATAMGIYKFLFNNDNHEDILNYCNDRLRKLEEYDHANGTFLLDTLVAYYMNGFSVGKTAEELFIHRNSLQYRLNKIQELVDFELDDYMEYLDVVNCILIKRLMFS